jgi:hypothetical protein
MIITRPRHTNVFQFLFIIILPEVIDRLVQTDLPNLRD